MSETLQKVFFSVIAFGVSCIAIELVPISKQSAHWNRCFEDTLSWADESPQLSKWEQKAKESLAVGVCNGAVYEPRLKNN